MSQGAGGRRWRRVAVAALLAAVLVTPGRASAGETGGVDAAPVALPLAAALTVTPSTDLVDRQVVAVEGTGFAPDATVYVVECQTGVAAYSGCAPAGAVPLRTDAGGSFATSFVARRYLSTPDGRVVECAPVGGCRVAVVTENLVALADAPLGFDPTVPPLDPVVSMSPASPVRPGQVVTVSGTGFVPGEAVGVSQCGTTRPGCGAPTVAVVGDDGRFEAELTVVRGISTTFSGVVDCAEPGACVIELDPPRPGSSAALRLALTVVDDGTPLPVQLQVTPSTDLVDGQWVEVESFDEPARPTGLGRYGSHGGQGLQLCRAGATGYDDGGCVGVEGAERLGATATGSRWRMPVRRVLDTPGGRVDCAAVACVVVLDDTYFRFASAPIAFAAARGRAGTVAPAFTG